ncbi:hypothetical protein CSOJ01_10073 [Colletotrichum sojae]|uniref:Uncharacterized protein n=1 Tax=Colletotrichum sojae TaxID=2175907 RepID=A0A8H6MQJ4_9PEZI|nr:hypothetical protein CSOJ01_10073 [Colletotrichum sojae]
MEARAKLDRKKIKKGTALAKLKLVRNGFTATPKDSGDPGREAELFTVGRTALISAMIRTTAKQASSRDPISAECGFKRPLPSLTARIEQADQLDGESRTVAGAIPPSQATRSSSAVEKTDLTPARRTRQDDSVPLEPLAQTAALTAQT